MGSRHGQRAWTMGTGSEHGQQAWWLAPASRGSSCSWTPSRKQRVKTGNGQGLSSQGLPPMVYFLQQGLRASQVSSENTTNWGPSVQMPETMGNIPYSNHYTGTVSSILIQEFKNFINSGSLFFSPHSPPSPNCFNYRFWIFHASLSLVFNCIGTLNSYF